MKAIIFCAGKSTRLRPLTNKIPKPLLPMPDGRTILEHILDLFKKYEIRDIFLVVHYLGNKIENYFKDGKNFGLKINYIRERKLLGTANHLQKAKEYLRETFIAANGDELKDINLETMIKYHKRTGALVTMAITEVKDPSSYGVVEFDGKRITNFIEKPKGNIHSRFINAGLYVMEPRILNYIPKDYAMLEKKVFPRIAKKGELYGFLFQGQWFDTGTPERYEEAKKGWKPIS